MEVSHHATVLRVDSPCNFVLPAEYIDSSQPRCIERFGIDDARELIHQAYQRPGEGEFQLLIIQTEFITNEAQNALLKVLEEPPSSTKFLFVLPHDHFLLPTLASRLFETADEGAGAVKKANEDFEQFCSLAYGERIATIEQKTKKNDLDWQRSIKRGLTDHLTASKMYRQSAELEYVARLLLTRGASNKMLLEQAALTLPVS